MSSDSEFVFCSDNLPKKNYHFFEDMRRKGILCDITFKVGDRSISAHRNVLAAGIPYFRDAIYNHATAETFQKVMEIPEMHYFAFEALIEFVYSSKITITLGNVKGLLSAACALHVEEVREACCKFLKDRLDIETVSDIRNYVYDLKCWDLVETVDYYIRKNFDKVSESESFLNLSFSFLEELIRRDDLQVSSEKKVFESVIRWVKHSPIERSAELPDLLRNVRLTLLNPRYLCDYVESQEFIRTSIPCRDLIDEAKNYHFFPGERQKVSSFRTEQRKFKDTEEKKTASVSNTILNPLSAEIINPITTKVFKPPTSEVISPLADEIFNAVKYKLLSVSSNTLDCKPQEQRRNRTRKRKPKSMVKVKASGICRINATTTYAMQCFNSATNKWCTCASKTIFHKNGLIAEMENKVYAIFEFLSLEYDLTNDELQCFNGRYRQNAGAAVLDGSLYVCGGADTFATNLVERLDPKTKEWAKVPEMISCRKSPGIVSSERCIYALGGTNSHNLILRGVERFNALSQKWTGAEPMLVRKYAPASAALNDKIYVCGGVGKSGWLRTAEVFDTVTNKWTFVSCMSNVRQGFSLLPYSGKLYAVGGYSDDETPINTVEYYYPETNAWWLFGPSVDSDIISGAVVIS